MLPNTTLRWGEVDGCRREGEGRREDDKAEREWWFFLFRKSKSFSNFSPKSGVKCQISIDCVLTGHRRNWGPDLWSVGGALHSPTLTGRLNLPGNLETASEEYCAPWRSEGRIQHQDMRYSKKSKDKKDKNMEKNSFLTAIWLQFQSSCVLRAWCE